MSAILKLLILGVLMSAHLVLALPQLKAGIPYVPSAEGLATLIMNAHLNGTNPERPFQCFTEYIQETNKIGSKYSIDYGACVKKSHTALSTVELEVALERRGIVSEAERICNSVSRCNTMKNTLELFNCHAEVGSNNTQSSYIISANASDFASILQENYRAIGLREKKCFSMCERVYVENTTRNYRLLRRCLDGRQNSKPTNITTSEPSTTLGWASTTPHRINTPWPATASIATESTSSTTTINAVSSTTELSVDISSESSFSTTGMSVVDITSEPSSNIPEVNVNETVAPNI